MLLSASDPREHPVRFGIAGAETWCAGGEAGGGKGPPVPPALQGAGITPMLQTAGISLH